MILLSLATAGLGVWLVLLTMVSREDWVAAAYNAVLQNMITIQDLQKKDARKQRRLAEYRGFAGRAAGLLWGGDSHKEIARLTARNQALQTGNFRALNLFIMPGYVLLRKLDIIGRGSVHKKLLLKNMELYGRKHAENKTKHLLAGMLSYPILGVSLLLSVGTVMVRLEQTAAGLAVMGVGSALILVLVYAMYDEVADRVRKRREEIARQFPNVVTKLALLVSSGMILSSAWKQTAYSQDDTLYVEMRGVTEELEQNISPEAAYGNFINRCGVKETSKLASAILQNLSKGNAEIGILLQAMARESWQERRHMAKRDAERANAKLMIPTMLLFLAILIIIMVPIAMSFSTGF